MPDKSRYPGVKPYETDDQNIFFGRSKDIRILFDLIRIEKTLLLYSKSGLGKTSLINAGLIPQFITAGEFNVFTIRFGIHSETSFIPPKRKVIEILNKGAENSPLLAFPELKEDTFSYWLKATQIQDPEKTHVLIFDQFEELFTYPQDHIEEFSKELYEVIYLKTSPFFRRNLIELVENNPTAFSKEQFNELSSAINIRFLFVIRSDFLSKLNHLTNWLPNLQRTFYELNPLETEDAKQAIIEPAKRKGDFSTPGFEYTPETVEKIIGELSDHNQQPIETFQLQIVCQYAENVVSKNPGHLVISSSDLGEINDIHQRFYDTLISNLPIENEDERLRLRILLEEDFIYEPEQRRLQVLKGKLLKKISEETLFKLEKTHLIRSEPYQNTFTYELSHDTLVEPILKSFRLRVKEEEKKKEDEEKEQTERLRQAEIRSIQQKNRRQRNIIFIVSFAALISIGCAIFGFSMWQKAVQEKKNAQKLLNSLINEEANSNKAKYEKYVLEGNSFKDAANYSEAIQMYRIALNFAVNDDLGAVRMIEDCKWKIEIKGRFQNLMLEGSKLQENENTYADALVKYDKALFLDFDNQTVQLRINELNSKIDIAVRKIKDKARIFIDANGYDYARKILLTAKRMKPSDLEIDQLLKECK
jgi:hypothetical protein